MAKPDKQAALNELTEAREALAAYDGPGDSNDRGFHKRNDRVVEAEQAVKLGRHRGWKF